MVKGRSKHVIIVKNPDNRTFEQAIFFIKGDIFRKSGKTELEIIAEAQAAAESYVKKTFGRGRKKGERCESL